MTERDHSENVADVMAQPNGETSDDLKSESNSFLRR